MEASREPEAPPAPTRVCNSSMKMIIFSFISSSIMTLFIRSSNWPRYFVPATIAARSRDSILWLCNTRGTVLRTILCANPSIIAVFPTPGSPIRAGLFFLRRVKTWDTRSISFSRPMTGSSFPFRASLVISREKWSRVGVRLFEDGSVSGKSISSSTLSPSMSSDTESKSRLKDFKTSQAIPSVSRNIANRRCSSSAKDFPLEAASL